MMHRDCITCRRLEAERQAAAVSDTLGLLGVVLGTLCVCALAWLLR